MQSVNPKLLSKIATFLFAIIISVAFITGCFLPVKGFREDGKPKQEHKPPSKRTPETPPQGAPDVPNKYKKEGGVYHTVTRGETVFRISKIYNVSQEDIIEANGIQDVTKVRVGQVLFIPGGKKSKRVDIALDDNHRPPPANPPTTPPKNPPRNPPPKNPPTTPPTTPPSTAEVEPETPSESNGACSPGSINLIWPAAGEVTSAYGIRNGRQHDGADISGPIGTPIYAAADGTVIYADRLGGYGLIVIVKHQGDLKTIYAHNRRNLVKKGEKVKQGDKIAELGNSGNATGPHLHFEIRCGQDAVDPIPFLPKMRTSMKKTKNDE